MKTEKFPTASKDALGRLLVGAAVGTGRRHAGARSRRWSTPRPTSSSSTPRTPTRAR
ncbi:MAG: IMP dehydrogenase [Candidatus Moduliflexus flocculans]|nr:IMP dehydrogenase [Candidatus Moduliflexus flocculans]